MALCISMDCCVCELETENPAVHREVKIEFPVIRLKTTRNKCASGACRATLRATCVMSTLSFHGRMQNAPFLLPNRSPAPRSRLHATMHISTIHSAQNSVPQHGLVFKLCARKRHSTTHASTRHNMRHFEHVGTRWPRSVGGSLGGSFGFLAP